MQGVEQMLLVKEVVSVVRVWNAPTSVGRVGCGEEAVGIWEAVGRARRPRLTDVVCASITKSMLMVNDSPRKEVLL